MCPMQSRMSGVRINDTPKFLADNPDEKTQSIIFNDPLNPNKPLIIPLVLKGSLVTSSTGIQEQVSMSMIPSRILT